MGVSGNCNSFSNYLCIDDLTMTINVYLFNFRLQVESVKMFLSSEMKKVYLRKVGSASRVNARKKRDSLPCINGWGRGNQHGHYHSRGNRESTPVFESHGKTQVTKPSVRDIPTESTLPTAQPGFFVTYRQWLW